MGYDKTEFRHVSFGTVLGEDRRPYKTRSGDTIGLESLTDEAIQNARKIVDENSSHLSEAERANVAVLVGMGAIIYVDLHHNRDSDYVFSWEKMLATTGILPRITSTPTHASAGFCGRVKWMSRPYGRGHPVILGTAAERALALQLNRFANAVADVAVDYRRTC